MLKSMTAYGRALLRTDIGDLVVEIQSVNRKFLEITAHLPKELLSFEAELKKWIAPYVARGQVTLKVSITYQDSLPVNVRPNLPLAKQLRHAWEEIAKQVGTHIDEFPLSLLANVEEIFIFEENLQEEEHYRHELKRALEMALEKFVHMKMQEGAVLQADIVKRIGRVREWMLVIEQKVPQATKRYREKLVARLEELLPGSIENEERILREVAVFAEKIDIAEEVTRFICHLNHFQGLIQTPNSEGVGKTLEFVLQELNREVNTVGSKSSDLEIARLVIDIKSELERIREQIQNVE